MRDSSCLGTKQAEVRIEDFDAAIFDLDGVVTQTARVHAASWKRLFDEYLSRRSQQTGEPFQAFDVDNDYLRYVDGKPRYDGVASFLESRGIALPYGDPSDSPDLETICGLGNRKNQHFRETLARDGVEVFDSSVELIHRLRSNHVKTALVSSSRNARAVVNAAGLEDLFDVCLDGNDAARLALKGKPHPDVFFAAAEQLGTEPSRAMVVEDAVSGVQAGRAGGFGLVVGVDRSARSAELRRNGADVVVTDLAELHVKTNALAPGETIDAIPKLVERIGDVERQIKERRVAVFLDYDGTLTPIVQRPELAILSDDMRTTVETLSRLCTVAIISGRDRGDVEKLVGLEHLVYAGSHGFDISGPGDLKIQHEEGAAFAASVRRAAEQLRKSLAAVEGALVEPKRFAVAVHYRQVADADIPAVEAVVDRTLVEISNLRKTYGKKVFELRPRLDWDKGKAVLWVLKALGLDGPDVLPFYLGDDTTDEDAFMALRERGIGIFVGCSARASAARYVLDSPAKVEWFLKHVATLLQERRHV